MCGGWSLGRCCLGCWVGSEGMKGGGGLRAVDRSVRCSVGGGNVRR